MTDAILKQAQDWFEGEIDFEGQKTAEALSTTLLSISGLLAFALGFYLQNIYITLWTGLAGTALTFLIVVPPYPFYNRHPLRWIRSSVGDAGAVVVDGKKVN